MGRWTVSNWLKGILALLVMVLIGASAQARSTPPYHLGTPVTPGQLANWDIDVNGLTGAGLPPGHGSVDQGSKIWEAKCAYCHGDFGEGAGKYPVIAGGAGSLTSERPEKTVGSFWPYAPTLFDYIKRAMPFPAPQSLSNDEVYSLTAYILNLNDVVPKTAVMDATTLAAVKMPNRNGFIKAEWDTKNTACMKNCLSAPLKVTSDLVNLHVTPEEKEVGNVGSTVDRGPLDAPAVAVAPAAIKETTSVAVAASGVTFATIAPIMAQRCTVCHSSKPTQPGFSAAPMGIKFDTPAEIKAQAAKIKTQAVSSHLMPIGNVTHMTDAERATLGKWIAAGAPLK